MEMNKQPSIVIDLKKYRLRIHKTTLRALNRPDYILILINPDEKELVIHRSTGEDFLAHKVLYAKLKEHTYELYSQNLIHAIMKVCPFMEEGNLYIAAGTVSPNKTLVKIPLKNAKMHGRKDG